MKWASEASSRPLDFFLFYIFWEIVLIPMFFLIGIMGRTKEELCSN